MLLDPSKIFCFMGCFNLKYDNLKKQSKLKGN